LHPLRGRRAEATAELERIGSRLDPLLELAEDRLITKHEYAARKARLEVERAGLEAELPTLDGEIAARAVTTVDVEATMRGLRRLGDVFDELEGVVDRRRLLATCLNRVVPRLGEVELHVPAYPLLASAVETGAGSAKVPGWVHSAPDGGAPGGAKMERNAREFPGGVSGASWESFGIRERMDARAATAPSGLM
jgi:hypothetical protein